MRRAVAGRLKGAIWSLARRIGAGWRAIWLHPKSELRKCGWFRSFRDSVSED